MARAALQSTFESLKCVVYQNITHIQAHTEYAVETRDIRIPTSFTYTK